MKWIMVVGTTFFSTLVAMSPGFTAGPPEQNVKQAYVMILSQADADKDGKLSVAECMTIYKDKTLAERNCTFWDIDKDGVITETEYIQQVSNVGKKK